MKEEFIKKNISKASLCEQLAEECAELAQCAIKMSRYFRQENLPHKSYSDIYYGLIEEYNDVALCASLLDLEVYPQRCKDKLERWVKRIENTGIASAAE